MKLLLFDIDGTLITTGGAGIRALNRAFALLFGVDDAMGGIVPAGKVDPVIVREVAQGKMGRDVTAGEMEAVRRAYLQALPAELVASPDYRVNPGVEVLLRDLSARTDLVLGLGTGNWEQGGRLKLDPSGLNRFFSFGGFGSDADVRSDVLRVGVSRGEKRCGTSFSRRDVFVLGDTVKDVEAGKAIGAVTVAVAAGHGRPEELRASNPDIFLNTFGDAGLFVDALPAPSAA